MFIINAAQKTTVFILSVVMVLSGFFFSCQKELSAVENGIATQPPADLDTKINSNVSGFVTDEADKAVVGAVVALGVKTTLTDKFGYFEIRNVSVVKEAAVVNVGMPGYFKAVKTWIAVENKSAFFRIKLIPKNTAGTLDAVAGGTVTLGNGLTLNIPANAVVNAATNATYTGQVNVAAYWISPTATDLYSIMPGDLRGVNSEGALKLLITYGMAAVELTGAGGELLQIVSGKKSTLTFPIPSSISGAAPATIPLWYFDETLGLWKQQGNAVKSGNNYVGDVSHFSYWNCDIPLDNSVTFDLTVQDATGKPISSANISVKYANGTYTGAHGLTDTSGYVKGRIPGNAQLVIEIFKDYTCNGPAYTQNITTTTADLSLGTITIGPNNTATISGSVTDCTNAAVTNGYVIVQNGFYNYKAVVKSDGTFSFDMLLCGSSSTSVSIIAVDNVSRQQSTPLIKAITSGNNLVGVVNACGTTIQEFVNYNINGTDYAFSVPTATITQNTESNFQFINAFDPFTQNRKIAFSFTGTGISTGSLQNLITLVTTEITDSLAITTPIAVNITEYGAVGQFIAGNLTGTFNGNAPANTPYIITCSFRVKRRN